MKNRYEYIVVLCCFLSLFVNIGLPSTSFAVYQPSIIAIVGDAGGSTILSVRILVSLAALTIVDRYYHLLDLRRGLALSMAFTALGFAVYAIANNLALFLMGSVLCGIAYGMGGMMATTLLVNRWFDDDVGTAIGAASVGSGVAGTVMPVIAARIIEDASLTAAFFTGAAIAFLAALFVLVFLRNRPADIGLQPHHSNATKKSKRATKHLQADASHVSASQEGALHVSTSQEGALQEGASQASSKNPRCATKQTPAYGDVHLSTTGNILLIGAMLFVGAFSMGGVAYLSVLLIGGGFDVHFAAALVSVNGLCLTVAKFAVGKLFDKTGSFIASSIMFIVLSCGLILLCIAGHSGTSAVVALIGIACMGCGLSLGSVGISVWSLQLSNNATRTQTMKRCQIAFAAGGFLMNLLPGPLKLITGSYVTAYILMLIFALAAAVIILGIYRKVAIVQEP